MQTYGQIGPRRHTFLTAYYHYLKDISSIKYKQRFKLDFRQYDCVPIPETLYNHILHRQLQSPHVKNSEYLIKLYKQIVNYNN